MSTPQAPTAATVGMFDGVHRGHCIILDTLTGYCTNHGLQPVVYTFCTHPIAELAPGRQPERISTNSDREALLLAGGAESVRVLDFKDIRSLTAAEFLLKLRQENCRALIMGFNNHIGSDRLNAAQANSLGIIPVVEAPTLPELRHVSSSAIRSALTRGDVDETRNMLGRSYSITGKVGSGRQIGRTIGFPTANIELPDQLLPADGVYAVDVKIEGQNVLHRGMANIGLRPTVGGKQRWLEVNIFDFDGNLYGLPLTVYFLRHLRPEQRFDSLEDLRNALAADRVAAKSVTV